MTKIALALVAVLLCVTSQARAQEDDMAAPEPMATYAAMSIARPDYMLPPKGLRYEGDFMADKAKAGGLVGLIGGASVLTLGLVGTVTGMYAWRYNASKVGLGGFVCSSVAWLGTMVLAPISFVLSQKSSIWRYHVHHNLINALGWVFYALSIPLAVVPSIVGLMIKDGTASFYAGYYGVIFGIAALTSSIALVLFGAKGLSINKMAKLAEAHNNAVSSSAETYQRKVAILPSVSPVVSGRKNLSGATLGVGVTF